MKGSYEAQLLCLVTSATTNHFQTCSSHSFKDVARCPRPVIVSIRSRKVISTSENDAACGRGRIASPPRKWLSAAMVCFEAHRVDS